MLTASWDKSIKLIDITSNNFTVLSVLSSPKLIGHTHWVQSFLF
jgi:hypothetical protein